MIRMKIARSDVQCFYEVFRDDKLFCVVLSKGAVFDAIVEEHRKHPKSTFSFSEVKYSVYERGL